MVPMPRSATATRPAPSSTGATYATISSTSPALRNAAARVAPPSRKTCCRPRAYSSASAACGSRVRRCSGGGRVVEDPAARVEVALPHHHPQRLVADRPVVLVADGQRGVVDGDRVGADQHRVAQRPEPVGVAAGGGAGDPAAGAVRGGAAAVERGGELPGDERAAVVDGEGPDPVELAGLVDHQPVLDLDARPPAGCRRRRRRPGCRPAGRRSRGVRRPPPGRLAQGPVRPVWLQGSRVTTAVLPRAEPPARARASASACRLPAPRWKPSATRTPASSRRTQPTRGLGPSGTPGVRASSRARVIARLRSAAVNPISPLLSAHGLRGRRGEGGRLAPRGTAAVLTCVRFPSGLSPSVQEFHLVNRSLATTGSRTFTAGSELHRPQSTRVTELVGASLPQRAPGTVVSPPTPGGPRRVR